jgi:hypothetical protein
MYSTASNNPILPDSERPEWLHYPQELLDLVRSGRMPLVPWHFDRAEAAANQYRRFRSHLRRELVPFAYRQDREDLACFEKGKGHEVFIIHDNTDPGWEDEGHFASFSDWLREVETEAAEWADDERRLSREAE